jgi:hypothetical protein
MLVGHRRLQLFRLRQHPRSGIEHRPVAEKEVHVLLFEPAASLNTGNVQNDLTVEALEHI